jgi:signal transduction histidine kinase
MRIDILHFGQKLLRRLRLWPLSLAEKCRLTFGAAIILVLVLALLLPYIWMGQLTKRALLDAARVKAETLMQQHFQREQPGQATLPALGGTGAILDPNERQVQWVRFSKDPQKQPKSWTKVQERMLKTLKAEDKDESIILEKKHGVLWSNYVRIFKANNECLRCHNPERSATAFSSNELIGAVVIQRPAADVGKINLMNLIWVIAAGLIAGVGAVVAFYMITQKVILSPIRQLRAIANNVAEGNLDTRSAIKTGDEYEKLANAFNHMLDRLQSSQEKLRQVNIQLDGKIMELSERNIELFRANKVKDEFLANISHEFRTPLNTILGFAEILREKPALLTKEKVRKYIENIITSGNRLLNMVNDLLNIAKIEAGKMQLNIEETSVAVLCTTVAGQFSALTKKKKIKVKLAVDENIPILMTDAGKVQQVLYNFLSNAVKFTPEHGRVEIRAEMADEKTVRISVTDTGCGIAEADKEKIFEKFRQGDGSLTRESAGSGLGLAISRELASLLAGSIGMESELGKGSTFRLFIPVILTQEQSAAK